MVLSQTLYTLTTRLTEAGIDSASVDAKLLLQYAFGCDAAGLVAHSQRPLTQTEIDVIERLVFRRLNREPMSQILGYKDFWRDRFIVSPEVLTPRPDSETLIEAMLTHQPKQLNSLTLLDLGTGSGCLLLSLLREYPNAHGLGIDQSEAALELASKNAQTLGLADRAEFRIGNWMQTLQSRYDMIISNPPYIEQCDIEQLEPEVRDYEPIAALTGGDDGLDAYRQILADVPHYLSEHGLCVMELGAGQATAVSALAATNNLSVREIKKDLNHIPRAIVLTHLD